MQEQLKQHVAARTDEDLYEMLFLHREDWTPEALAIAEEEWKRRDLTPEKLAIVQAICEERHRQRVGTKDQHLSTAPKVFFFIFNFFFALGLLQLLIAHTLYKSNGYERKFKESILWMAFGSTFYGAVFLIFHWYW